MLLKPVKTNGIIQLLAKYLAEVLIIFLGITISFLFEQWREEKRQQKELIELSESLLTDISALNEKLANDLNGSTAWIDQLDSLRQQRGSGKISERQLNWFYKMVTGQFTFLFDPYSPTYMSAASSGLIHELPDTIKNQLYDLYRVQLPLFQMLYQQQQENITNFRTSTMVPSDDYLYHYGASQIKPHLQILAEEIQRPVYGNFINQIIITEKTVYEMNEEAMGSLKKLQMILRDYVQRFKS